MVDWTKRSERGLRGGLLFKKAFSHSARGLAELSRNVNCLKQMS